MADDSELAALRTKIEKEARFTRSLVVICTAAVLGVSLVPVKIMLTDLPTVITNDFEGKLEQIHDHWAILDKTMNNRHGGAGAGKTEAAPAAAPEGESKPAEEKK